MGKTISTGYISDTINGIVVNSSIKCHTSNYNDNSGRNVDYVVMHYTGNTKDIAKNNATYFSGANRSASAHLFVDDSEIYQSVELRDVAWHCGTSGTYYHSSCRNANSIGIEMCCTAGNYKVSETTKKNAAYLCAYICKMLGISASNVDTYVLRHYDVTHKQCPAQMAGSGNVEWTEFKNMVKNILNGSNTTTSSSTSTPTTKEVYGIVTGNNVNVRKTPSTSGQVLTTVNKGTRVRIWNEENGWYMIDNDKWISTTYVTKESSTSASVTTTTSTTTTTQKTTEVYGVVTGNSVNVRKEANSSSAIVGQVSNGQRVRIWKESGNWYMIDNDKWVSATYVKKESSTTSSTSTTTTPSNIASSTTKEVYGIVTGNNVNVRKTPSTSGQVLTTVNKGTRVRIWKEQNGWYMIDNDKWISATYVTKE